jgi:hypothetical protein
LESVQKKAKFKLVLYQRDLSRKLANEEEALKIIRKKLSANYWEISVGSAVFVFSWLVYSWFVFLGVNAFK